MEAIAKRLWNDEEGFIVSLELILIATIAVIGLIVGLTTVRNAVVTELSDVAGAVQDMNQSYTFNAVTATGMSSAGSAYDDNLDASDSADDPTGTADNGVLFTVPPSNE